MLVAARRSAITLCVGIDTDPSGVRVASARAARPPRRGGLPNALFLAGDATELPAAFHERADEITVTLPWGSLLQSVLMPDQGFVRGLTRALRANGRLRVLVSVEERDRRAIAAKGAAVDGGDLGPLARALENAGLEILERREVTSDDVRAIRSSWARRLGIPTRRSARLLVAVAAPASSTLIGQEVAESDAARLREEADAAVQSGGREPNEATAPIARSMPTTTTRAIAGGMPRAASSGPGQGRRRG